MNSRAIRSLRQKFILLSMAAYLIVMIFAGGGVNLANYITTSRQIRMVLESIVRNGGEIPRDVPAGRREEEMLDFAPEYMFSVRYFSVIFDEEGETDSINVDHISSVSDADAEHMAKAVLKSGRRHGRLGYLFYSRGTDSRGRTVIAFLNGRSQLSAISRVFTITVLITLVGFLVTFILVYIFSSRVIQPEIENVRRQKQFITNASHELKTPLAVIRANTEIEEMMNGSNEWTQSTMRQIDRLSGLIANLVMITRAEEREDRSVMTEIDVSACVDETVSPYESLALQDRKTLDLGIAPNVKMVADESKIRQLASLLVDNAFKYCDDEGTIRVRLDSLRKGRTIRLIVSNSFSGGAGIDYSRYFDRFYRADQSHNTDRGGYGIGLSIAESICHQYGGSITAAWKNGEIIFTCLLVSKSPGRVGRQEGTRKEEARRGDSGQENL